jgi:tetratricopeptide (TPR) repeat protein
MRRLHLAIAAGLACLACLAAPIGAQAPDRTLDEAIAAAYTSVYNLDQDAAIASARRAVEIAPEASRAHRTLAAMLWLDSLFRRGALTVDNYLGSITKAQQKFAKPPAELDDAFKTEIGKAIDLAAARVKIAPQDLDARYDVGAAWALRASYSASVEGSLSSAFMSARRAFDAHEMVLERDPQRVAAGVIVGTYRYVVSGLALPTRLFAYMAGMGGGKETGVALLEAAARDPGAHVDADMALVLIYSREGRHDDAFRLLTELAAAYPRNRLFVLERGAAAIRAGRSAEAEAILTRGLALFEQDPRRKIPGEHALWLYKRGLARLNQNHRAAALTDLDAALAATPEPWVLGRIRLARGKIHDLDGRRSEAVADYRAAKETGDRANDPASASEASRWLKRPFTFPEPRG